MTFEKSLPVLWVDSNHAFTTAVEILNKAPWIAVDVEADAMYHYPEKVCLLQMATDTHAILIDTLAISDVAPIAPLFENPDVLKIFHGGDFDVRSLYRDFHIIVNNLFDTQIACRFLGEAETGLESLLRNYFEIQVDKKYQKSDWSERPLSEEMKQYAIGDVIYLRVLQEILTKKLIEKDRLFWVAEEFERQANVRPQEDEGDYLFLRFKGAGRLKPRELALLEQLLCWRQETALKTDRPPYKIVGNETLMKLVTRPPLNRTSLKQSHILGEKQEERWGQEIVETILKARNIPSSNWPVYPRHPRKTVTVKAKQRGEKLKKWRDETAVKLEISDASVVANKFTLAKIAELDVVNRKALQEIPGIRDWQIRVFGDEWIRLLKE